jgi:geranylgeranyl pyrophosphate synthase
VSAGHHLAADARGALRASVADVGGPVRALVDEAADHVGALLSARPVYEVGAVAVPVAVFEALTTSSVPTGLLAAASATYVVVDVLDDVMDGDRPACWSTRPAGEIAVATHLLAVHGAQVIGRGMPPPVAERLGAVYRAMSLDIANGQLRAQAPLTVTTTPADVTATISAKSGAMLRRLAEAAAIAAGADDALVAAAGRFGSELAIARQHLNDITELLGDRASDLRNRTATMVGAFALQRRTGDERRRLLDDMAAAAGDRERRRRLVVELAPDVAEVCVLVGLHLGAARAAAAPLMGAGTGHHMLAELIDHTATTTRRLDERER